MPGNVYYHASHETINLYLFTMTLDDPEGLGNLVLCGNFPVVRLLQQGISHAHCLHCKVHNKHEVQHSIDKLAMLELLWLSSLARLQWKRCSVLHGLGSPV